MRFFRRVLSWGFSHGPWNAKPMSRFHARPTRGERGALHRIGVNRTAPSINSVGTCAITPLPIKSSRIGLLAGILVSEACGQTKTKILELSAHTVYLAGEFRTKFDSKEWRADGPCHRRRLHR